MRLVAFLNCLFLFALPFWSGSLEAADLVLFNGKIVTLDSSQPEVSALAATDGRIVALGSDQQIAEEIAQHTLVIDLAGRLAIPGFIEAHAHFLGIGDAKLQLELMSTGSWEDVVARVKAAVNLARPGELIRGRGWHQEKWSSVPSPSVDGLPYHDTLSAVSPDNPVVLVHASGHAAFANARAMELSGIEARTPDPDGGQIVRNPEGQPIGMFRETAMRLLAVAAEAGVEPSLRRRAELADKEVLSKGITSFQDAGSSFETVDELLKLTEEKRLGVRLYVMLRESNKRLAENLRRYKIIGHADNHLTVRAIKRSIDGALGSHGAWLLDPYSDLETSSGLNTDPVDVIRGTAQLAVDNGYQLCVHAIGDRANRETLDIFEAAYKLSENPGQLRWRVEHAQHLHPDDIGRFAKLGVVASMQGVHCTSDAPFVTPRLGEQRAREGAYVWRSLLDSGAVVCNGTDAPVEDVDPIQSFYATVSRRLKDGTQFYPDQRLTRMEALTSYTLSAAHAAFEEDLKGSLVLGKLADITVLSKDILTVPEEEIRSARVDLTIVGGEILHSRLNEGGAQLRSRIADVARPLVDDGVALGLVVGVLQEGQTTVRGFGRVSFDGDRSPDGDTVYEIGSISKTFTGLLLADAVERGLAAPDDSIAKHLPGDVRLSPDEGEILLSQLVSHTSGLPRLPDNLGQLDPQNPYVAYGQDDLYEYLGDYVLNSTPGETYAYSNLAAGLLGHLMTRTNGADSYDSLLIERICEPLRLTDTRIDPTPSMYSRLSDAALSGKARGHAWDFKVLEGCGAIHSTVNDLLRYAAAQMTPEGGPLAGAIQRSHTVLYQPRNSDAPVAYGWHLIQNGKVFFHNGQTGGFHSYLAFDPVRKLAVCVLSSSTSALVDALGNQLMRE